MPASARLLQKLKETWGDEVTQDLVTWVSEGQAVNRAELRELADLYFARFGDRLEGRIAPLDERVARLDERLARVDGRVARVEERIAGSEARLDARIADLRAEFASQMRDQMKWMFIFWAGTIVPLAGLMIALAKAWL